MASLGSTLAWSSHLLRRDRNDRAIHRRDSCTEDLRFLGCIEIVHSGPIGVVVDDHQPQGRISVIAREGGRNIVSPRRTWLILEARSRAAVRFIRIEVEAYIDR